MKEKPTETANLGCGSSPTLDGQLGSQYGADLGP